MMNSIVRHAVVIAALMLSVGPWSRGAHAHGVTLNVYHCMGERSAFHTQFMVPWVARLEEASGARLRIHLHAAEPGDSGCGDLLGRLGSGDADIVWTAVTPSAQRFAALGVLELPFMVRTAQGGSGAATDFVRLNDLAERYFEGAHLLAVSVRDGLQLHFPQGAVASPEELAGRRIGTSSAAGADLLAALGATPLEASGAALSAAIRNGAVDGVLLPWELETVIDGEGTMRAHTEIRAPQPGFGTSVFVLAMSRASYRALADDLRAVVNAGSGVETAGWIGRVFDDAAASARSRAESRGDAFQVIGRDTLGAWRKAARGVAASRARKLGQPAGRWEAWVDSAREQLSDHDPGR
ncbi:MAG: hypothetical protein GC151_08435 [Betaproteobacteria bacterium]|nr:hypothetical protein [Betaproteobacteria bacterium]